MPTLLVVDDDPVVLSVTARILETAGHTVLAAGCGSLALAAFVLNAPAVAAVLTDVAMPRMDGITLFRHVRRLREDVPVVFVTGSAHLVEHLVDREPRVAVLAKPFQMADLVSTVSRVLALVA